MALHLRFGWRRRRKCANGRTTKHHSHCAVFKFAGHKWAHALSIEPMFQRTSQGTIFRRHQKWHAIEALGKSPFGLARKAGMSEKAQAGLSEQMAECAYADGGIEGRIGDDQIQFVDRELREQFVRLALAAYQAERSRQLQRRKNEAERDQFGNDIRD